MSTFLLVRSSLLESTREVTIEMPCSAYVEKHSENALETAGRPISSDTCASIRLDGSRYPADCTGTSMDTGGSPVSSQPIIKLEKFEVLDSENALSELDALTGMHSDLQLLLNLTESAGFTEVAGSSFGWQVTVETAEEIRPGEGDAPGDPVNSLTSRALFKGFTGGGGAAPSLLAVGTMTATAGQNQVIEHLQLEAPGADMDRMIERKVEGNALVEVDGWWDRFRGCLGGCGGPCLAALTGCIRPVLPAILVCLAVRCGGCAAKCAACATCDCRWWCRISGCCRG